MSNEEMIAAIKGCAEKLGRAPTTRELSLATEGRLPRSLISRRFGTYTRALQACGLVRHDGARPQFKAAAETIFRCSAVPMLRRYAQA